MFPIRSDFHKYLIIIYTTKIYVSTILFDKFYKKRVCSFWILSKKNINQVDNFPAMNKLYKQSILMAESFRLKVQSTKDNDDSRVCVVLLLSIYPNYDYYSSLKL